MSDHDPDRMPSGREGTQVLQRAVQILRAVARIQRAGASLAAITRATNLSRSTAFRIVHFLTDEGLLEYDQNRGTYHIGHLAFELGLAARGQAALVEKWRPRLEQISKAIGMTAYLVARSDSEVVCLATVEAPSILRAISLVVGQRLPLGVGAGSLAILASLQDREIRSLIAVNKDKLRMYGDGKLTPERLWTRIELTRTNGYAFSEDTVASGVSGIGVTVPGTDQLTQLALSASAPSSEFNSGRMMEIAEIMRRVASPD